MSVLAHKWVSSGKLSGKISFSKARVCVILHGIMGSGRNWMTPAKRIVETNPNWKCLLIDHRCHGGSPPSDDSSTARTPREQIDSCAADVEATIAAATGEGTSITPSDPSVALLPCGGAPIIMGHSFGGKVALAYAHRRIKEDYSVPTKTWMLDSMPGRRRRSQTCDGPGSVGWVLSALERAASEGNKRGGFTKRSEIQSLLVTEGLDALTAAWLSQSVRKIKTNTNPPSPSLLEFGYDLPGVRTMFEAFGQADMWDDCFDLASRDSLGCVVAGDRHTGMWEGTEEHLTKLEAMGGGNNDRATTVVHEMPHAGHNVHVDDLDGLLKIIMEDHKDDWNH